MWQHREGDDSSSLPSRRDRVRVRAANSPKQSYRQSTCTYIAERSPLAERLENPYDHLWTDWNQSIAVQPQSSAASIPSVHVCTLAATRTRTGGRQLRLRSDQFFRFLEQPNHRRPKEATICYLRNARKKAAPPPSVFGNSASQGTRNRLVRVQWTARDRVCLCVCVGTNERVI